MVGKNKSLSLRERGLKSNPARVNALVIASLSLRERGLKCLGTIHISHSIKSLSLRERGLKCKNAGVQTRYGGVALLARAWIEILSLIVCCGKTGGRSPCESVD